MENENNEVLDFKITKRHFPRINNDRVLEFVFEKDPNLFMRKNKIIIKGAIEFDRWDSIDYIFLIRFKWIFCWKWVRIEIVFYDECWYW